MKFDMIKQGLCCGEPKTDGDGEYICNCNKQAHIPYMPAPEEQLPRLRIVREED